MECPIVLRDLRKIYRHFRVEAKDVEYVDSTLYVRIVPTTGGNCMFAIGQDNRLIGKISEKGMVVPFIVWKVSIWITWKISDRLLLIHGAMASSRRNGILLPGSRGSGKTTLLMALMMAGFTCVADDMIFVEPISRSVRPFPSALTVRRETFRHLRLGRKEVAWYTSSIERDKVTFIDPAEVGLGTVCHTPCRITHIIVANYSQNEMGDLRQISKRDTLLELFRCSRNFEKFRDRGLDILQSVVEQADCYRLTTSNVALSVKSIEHVTS